MSKPKYIPLDLECGHRLWFQRTHMPRKHDRIWCRSCQENVRSLRSVKDDGMTIWEGYYTLANKIGVMVGCNHETECNWTAQARTLQRAEQLAFSHIAREHGKSTLLNTETLTLKETPSEPDF